VSLQLQPPRTFLAVATVAALCLVAASSPSSAAPPESTQIAIKDFMFMPNSLTVKPGTAVTWVNRDDEPHSVVSDTGLFRSGAVDTNETFSFKFDKPGTYHFTCAIHPRMVGTIIVEQIA
jgi:plastocyanin